VFCLNRKDSVSWELQFGFRDFEEPSGHINLEKMRPRENLPRLFFLVIEDSREASEIHLLHLFDQEALQITPRPE
jgi:hypothetical protein